MNTVSASYLAFMVDTCADQGADRASLLAQLPDGDQFIEGHDSFGADKRVSAENVFRILQKTERLTGKPEIGLICGQNLRPSSLNEIGNAVLCCASLRQAIFVNRKYQALTQQLGRTNLKTEGAKSSLLWEPNYRDAEYGRRVTDLVMAGHAIFGRWLSWVHDKKINAVHFKHAKPDYADHYIGIFDCPVLFGQAENAMLIDTDAIDAPLPQANGTLLEEICQRLDIALARLQPQILWEKRVRKAQKLAMRDGLVNLELIAKRLGVSPRSLRRNLALENTSFRKVLEQTRRSLCDKYMHEGVPLLEISERLGYSQQSAFNRAFKSWFGATPKAYVRAQDSLKSAFNQLAP